jgi:hypothetical protein
VGLAYYAFEADGTKHATWRNRMIRDHALWAPGPQRFSAPRSQGN